MKTVLTIAVVMVVLLEQQVEAQEAEARVGCYRPIPVLPGEVLAVQHPRQIPMLPVQKLGSAQTTDLKFTDLVQAKIDINVNGKQVIMMLEAFRTETQKTNVVIVGDHKITQLVARPNGNVEEREFDANLPIEHTVERDVHVPTGLKPKLMSLDDFQFFNLDAKPVPIEDAAKILSTLKPVFLFDRFAGELYPVGSMEKQILNPDALIVTSKKTIRDGGTNTLMMNVTPRIIIPDE